jgi:hypothetical protein
MSVSGTHGCNTRFDSHGIKRFGLFAAVSITAGFFDFREDFWPGISAKSLVLLVPAKRFKP